MPKILVIDDDRLVREAVQVLLRARGYDVTAASDGGSGIAALKVCRFDVVIVDLFMPDMDGLSVMQAIRQTDPKIPMIAASGFMFGGSCPEMPGFQAMAAAAGAAFTLYKPFRPHEVLRVVEEALQAAAV
jgi:two-component system, chemotaxis family, chemotaxis protein CheY